MDAIVPFKYSLPGAVSLLSPADGSSAIHHVCFHITTKKSQIFSGIYSIAIYSPSNVTEISSSKGEFKQWCWPTWLRARWPHSSSELSRPSHWASRRRPGTPAVRGARAWLLPGTDSLARKNLGQTSPKKSEVTQDTQLQKIKAEIAWWF